MSIAPSGPPRRVVIRAPVRYNESVASRLRITGLVSLAESVRRELAAPLSAAGRDRLRARVAQSLGQVEEIAARAGSRIDRLPAPSRRAVDFLRSIDWAGLTLAADEVSAPASRHVAWRGLAAFVARSTDRLARPIPQAEVDAVRLSIEKMSGQIEGTIDRQKLLPAQLTPATREMRGWLAFFSRDENMAAYVSAREAAREAFAAAGKTQRRFAPPFLIHFRPMRGIYKMRVSRAGSIVSLPAPMIAFDRDGFKSLASMIFRSDRNARMDVIRLTAGEGFQSIRAELEVLGGIVEATRGVFFDLRESFDRVNATYFAGAMPRPRLTWSRSFTGRKFGHYDWVLDTVMVSSTLDSRDVPAFVVDFIMYHELLHKKHGLYWVNGRGYAHTSEFYREERLFEKYEESEAILEKLARGARLRREGQS